MAVETAKLDRPAKTPPGLPCAEQVYVTHCLLADSVKNNAGYSIRAKSSDNQELQRFAFEFPAYQLPRGMDATQLPPAQAPTRLALVEAPAGKSALIHSSFLSLDSIGRPGSYFTHALFYDSGALSLQKALESWGSPNWACRYDPGAPKELERFEGWPAHGLIKDSTALSRFLQGGAAAAHDKELARICLPQRLAADPQARLNLLAQALYGCLMVLDPKNRPTLYVLAEPGLCAMLLYGAACLLPQPPLRGLSFSTYEDPLISLRNFKAKVIGTYLPDSQALPAEYGAARGYLLDTFNPQRSSPALQVPPEIVRWLAEWAARDNPWDGIQKFRDNHRGDSVTLESLQDAKTIYGLIENVESGKVASGQAGARELIELHRKAPRYCAKNGPRIWPIARHHWSDPSVQDCFLPLFAANVQELAQQAARFLAEGKDLDWRGSWELLKKALPEVKDRQVAFAKMMQGAAAAKIAVPMRKEVLRYWDELKIQAAPPPELDRLLYADTPEELPALCKSLAGYSKSWTARCLLLSSKQPHLKMQVGEVVRSADAELLGAFGAQLAQCGPADQAQGLSLCVSPESLEPLHRLLALRPALDPNPLVNLLRERDSFARLDSEGWLDGDNLANLWTIIGAGPDGEQVLGVSVARLKREMLLGRAPDQEILLDKLSRLHTRQPLPPRWDAVLGNWVRLHRHFKDPDGSGATCQQLYDSIKALGLGRSQLLKDYLDGVKDIARNKVELERFAKIVGGLLPPETTDGAAISRFENWRKLTQHSPHAQVLEEEFIKGHVGRRYWQDLVSNNCALSEKTLTWLNAELARERQAKAPPGANGDGARQQRQQGQAARKNAAAGVEASDLKRRLTSILQRAAVWAVVGLGCFLLGVAISHLISADRNTKKLDSKDAKIETLEEEQVRLKKQHGEELGKMVSRDDFTALEEKHASLKIAHKKLTEDFNKDLSTANAELTKYKELYEKMVAKTKLPENDGVSVFLQAARFGSLEPSWVRQIEIVLADQLKKKRGRP